MGSGHLPLSLLSTPRPSILFSINRDSLPRYHSNRFLVSVRPSVSRFMNRVGEYSIFIEQEIRLETRLFSPPNSPAIISSIGGALILCAIKRFINRADKFGNSRRGCLRVILMRRRSISGNRVDRLLAVKGDGARRIGSCSAATPVGTQRQR